jgi:hypothetical protein
VAEASSAISGARRPARGPWTQAWIDALPLAPVWTGLALAAGHVLLGGVYHALLVAPRPGAWWAVYREVLDSTAVFALLIGYAPAALAYARRGHRTLLRELRPTLSCSEAEFSELEREAGRFDMPVLRIVGGIAALCGISTTLFTTGILERFHLGSATLSWVLWQNGAAFWLMVRSAAHDLRVSAVVSRATERHAEVDPLALGPLAPLARRGLQSALLIVLGISIFSLLLGVGNVSPLLPVAQASTVALAAFALVLPSIGVHRRIRSARREELGRLASEIHAVRERSSQAPGAEAPSLDLRLASLLTLRQHVEDAREWPFDLGTLGRFLLYAAIGVGSWLGGAIVERLLDLLIG